MNQDFTDMLSAFSARGVRYLVVGAHALAAHGHPRATGDLDLWVEAEQGNARRVLAALGDFGAPLFDLSEADLCTAGVVFQMGVPPGRIDILTGITGVGFAEAWERRVVVELAGMPIPFLARVDLVRNKRAAGRPKDLADVWLLESEDVG